MVAITQQAITNHEAGGRVTEIWRIARNSVLEGLVNVIYSLYVRLSIGLAQQASRSGNASSSYIQTRDSLEVFFVLYYYKNVLYIRKQENF